MIDVFNKMSTGTTRTRLQEPIIPDDDNKATRRHLLDLFPVVTISIQLCTVARLCTCGHPSLAQPSLAANTGDGSG